LIYILRTPREVRSNGLVTYSLEAKPESGFMWKQYKQKVDEKEKNEQERETY
jgi:hypothetical protein